MFHSKGRKEMNAEGAARDSLGGPSGQTEIDQLSCEHASRDSSMLDCMVAAAWRKGALRYSILSTNLAHSSCLGELSFAALSLSRETLMAFVQRNSPPGTVLPESNRPPSTNLPDMPGESDTDRSLWSARSRHQFGLFLAGAGFCVMSALVTRRALLRRYIATTPPFYQPNSQPRHVNGPAEAAQALGLATLNVTSFAIMATGGTLWALDISNLAEMRRKMRGGLGIDGADDSDRETEEKLEEWLAAVLSRKHEEEGKKTASDVQQTTKPEHGASR
ncbi:MAG: hypothetical protein Q9165_001812 [Trypethelium subeluteriae]